MKKPHTYTITDEAIQKLVNETTTCLNCGRRLKYINDGRNRGYCDIKCWKRKPPKMAYIEYEYGKPAKQILAELLNRNDNATVVADMFGVTRQTLYRWIDKAGLKRKVTWE